MDKLIFASALWTASSLFYLTAMPSRQVDALCDRAVSGSNPRRQERETDRDLRKTSMRWQNEYDGNSIFKYIYICVYRIHIYIYIWA